MAEKKMTAPVLAHRNGQRNEPTQKLTPILPLLRAAVKTACVTLGFYIAAAVAEIITHLILGYAFLKPKLCDPVPNIFCIHLLSPS